MSHSIICMLSVCWWVFSHSCQWCMNKLPDLVMLSHERMFGVLCLPLKNLRLGICWGSMSGKPTLIIKTLPTRCLVYLVTTAKWGLSIWDLPLTRKTAICWRLSIIHNPLLPHHRLHSCHSYFTFKVYFLTFLQVRSLNAQLAETSDERSRVEDRLNTLTKSMTEVEEDKRGLGMIELCT